MRFVRHRPKGTDPTKISDETTSATKILLWLRNNNTSFVIIIYRLVESKYFRLTIWKSFTRMIAPES